MNKLKDFSLYFKWLFQKDYFSLINYRIHFKKPLLYLFVFIFLFFQSLKAAYIPVYTINTNGGIHFTGNTLGLNKATNQNQPGTSGSIGAFITTDTTSQVGNYPVGTTLNWQNSLSTAVLDIPANSTILHAELIWAGSYGFGNTIPLNQVDVPITFITPDNVSHSISPNPLTAQSRVQTATVGGFYVRSADVTSLISNTGGTYTVGGVPATVVATENNLNCAGWTLAVAFANSQMLTSNLTLFVGCEASGAPPALVSGFHAPHVGNITSVIFASCLEGDPSLAGDHFLIGSTIPLSYPANAIFGSNNPSNNFFGSQINTLLPSMTDPITGKVINNGSALLDTRGSFGQTNSSSVTSTGVSGARQGYDITAISVGSLIANDQIQFYAQGTTDQDVYTVNALGIQIQVLAPVIQSVLQVDQTTISLNSLVTYTSTFTNTGEATANNLIFTDNLPSGLTFVPNSLSVNGVNVPNADINNGVSLGNLAVNDSVKVVFQAVVSTFNPPNSFDNFSKVSYTFIPLNSAAPTSNLDSQTNTVTISGNYVPPPVANPDTGTTQANTALNGLNVLTNDTGSNLSIFSYDATSMQGGSVLIQPNGKTFYTPPNNFSGIDTFNYTLTDFLGQKSSTTVTITVSPVAIGDSASVAANTLLNQRTSVLNNDIGTNLIVSAFDTTSSQGGTVKMNPDGTYTYQPASNFSGLDTFNYTIMDSFGTTAMATVTIRVLPVAKNNTGTTPANTPLNGSTVFSNDVGTGLTLIAYDSVSTQGGQVMMNTQTGTYVYTPPNNFSGSDTFTYTIQDQSGSQTTATVTITVLPLAIKDAASTNANTVLDQTVSVLSNDLGSGLHVTSYDAFSSQGGSVAMQTNGTYTYTPPDNFSGLDAFNYTATDATGNTTTAKVFLTVLPVANPDTATLLANSVFTSPSVLNNDSGTGLMIQSFQTSSMQGGTVAMNTDGTYTYTPPMNFSGFDAFIYTAIDSTGNTATAIVTIQVLPVAENETGTTSANTPLNGGTVFNDDLGTGLTIATYDSTSVQGGQVTMNKNTGTYTYTPPNNFSGTDTFTYTIQDQGGSQSTGTVTVTVLPVAVNDTATTNANTPLNQTTSVLSNDLGSNLTIQSYNTSSLQGGTVTMQNNGTYTYTPPLNFSGFDSFNYTAVDSSGNTTTATVTVHVLPLAKNDTGTTPANTPLNGSTLFTNNLGTGLTLVSYDSTSVQGGQVKVNKNDGTYLYVPPANFSGVDTFTYTVQDQSGADTTATVTIVVLPVAINDVGAIQANTPLNQTISVLSNDLGSGLTIQKYDATSAQGGTVVMNSGGSYTYTPPLNFSGFDTFNYTAVDSTGNTATAIVTIQVLPIAENDTGLTTANTPLSGATVFTNDLGKGLSLISYDKTSTQGGQVTMNKNTGTYTYIPPSNFSGIDSFTYTVQDQAGAKTTATVTITVLPVALNDTATTDANTSLNQTASVLSNDLGSGLSIQNYSPFSAQGGTVVMQPNGTYSYLPPLNFSGPDSFNYTLIDSAGNLAAAQVLLTVLPLANPDAASTFVNVSFKGLSVLDNDLGTQLTIENFQAVSNYAGTVVMNSDGTYTYTPPFNFSGLDTFNYTARDYYGNLATSTVTIKVLPAANNQNFVINVNTPLQSNVLVDDKGSNLSVLPLQQTTSKGGVVNLSSDGSFTYLPATNFSGADQFTYTLIDGSGNSTTATVFIVVLPLAVNDSGSTSINTPLVGQSVLLNDKGSQLTVLSYTPLSQAGGKVTLNLPTGVYTYFPPAGFLGTDHFSYTLIDGEGNTSTAVVTINVFELAPPSQLKGKTIKYEFLNKNDYELKMSWTPSASPNVVAYRLYYKKKLIAEVSANHKLVFKTCISSIKAAKFYSVTAVNSEGAESTHTKIRITHE